MKVRRGRILKFINVLAELLLLFRRRFNWSSM